MRARTPGIIFSDILRRGMPQAEAQVGGNQENPNLMGTVKFYNTPYGGVLVEAEISGLPDEGSPNASDFYALHIHEHGDCTLPFDKVGAHFSSVKEPHPYHSGDMVPLLSNQGYAWMAFYDKRFTIEEIMGRSVIIHAHHDDFTTQPSGNAGPMIGCGVIQ